MNRIFQNPKKLILIFKIHIDKIVKIHYKFFKRNILNNEKMKDIDEEDIRLDKDTTNHHFLKCIVENTKLRRKNETID